MSKQASLLYEFGSFIVDARENLLLRDGKVVPLTPKAFETLLVLIENSGHVLSKDELMGRVWPDSFVEENNLSQNISLLRKVLRTTGKAKYIETVPKRGYRFVAHVARVPKVQSLNAQPHGDNQTNLIVHERTRMRVRFEEEEAETTPQVLDSSVPALVNLSALPEAPAIINANLVPEFALKSPPVTKYAKSGDVNIAYQTIGDAPLDLVFVMGWVTHLEYFWTEPSFARFLSRLASFSRLILFDKRGTGLSDRVPVTELPTLEQRMDDVRAVMDAVGSERAALCGVSEGGPMSALFAATYPEKTSALIMIGTYAKRLRDADYPWAPTTAEREKFYELMQTEWGGPVGLEERAPSAADDPRFREWWATYLRMGASPGAALALTKMNADIDVRAILPTIRVPTLVIHRAEDACLKIEEGRYVAERIPGARFVELPGADHLPFVGDQDAILDEVEEFLTGVRHTLEPGRVLATVLVAHTVGARSRAGNQDLLRRYEAYARKEIGWFRGREVATNTNEQLLATFDGPARAIRAGCAISEYARRLGIETKIGLHTGECDVVEGGVGGVAVETGKQVAAHCNVNEVLVSSTVKDLVAGSGIRFEERGLHSLKGAGEWRLFAVERSVCHKST